MMMRPLLILFFGLVLIGGCRSREAEDVEVDEPGTEAAGTTQPSPEPDAASQSAVEALEQALEHEDTNRRLGAAWGLTARQDVPDTAKARLLVNAIENEIREPTPGEPRHGTYLSNTERIKSVYTRALGELDDQALEIVRRAADEETGELGARAILALGYAGDRDAIPGLRGLLSTAENGEVRADAAYLLGVLGASEAIPDLRQALDDPYRITVEGRRRTSELYRVREQAMGALKEMGLTVEITEEGEYRVVEG